jgi:import receptor subunit TOM22
MVKIEEVADEWSDDDGASSAGSDISDSDLQLAPFNPNEETFGERLYALRDMIPPSTRASVSNSVSYTAAWVKWTASKLGSAAWITTTSALLVGLPLMLSIEGEAGLMAQEAQYLGQVRTSVSKVGFAGFREGFNLDPLVGPGR